MQLSINPYRYRWIVLTLAWTSYMTIYLSRLSIGPLGPFLKDAFSLSNTQVGSLSSAASILYGPTLIIAGWLVDRLGVRRMLVTGTLIVSLCIISLFFVNSYQAMLIILVLSGLGAGCIFPSAVKAIMLWFPLRERGTAVGINQTGVNFGGIIGASLLPITAITLGWRFGFLFIGLGALAMCLFCAVLYRNPPQEVLPPASGNEPDNPLDKSPATRLTIELFKSRDIWVLGMAGLFLCIVEFSAMAYLVLYLTENWFFGVVAAGGLLAMAEAAGALGKPANGFISDRFLGGRRKIVFLYMGVISAITCLVLGASGNTLGWLLYPVIFSLGIGSIGWGGLSSAIAVELGGKEAAGVAAGTTAGIFMIGAVTGPLLFGYIVDSTGSFETAWYAMAICSVISIIFISMIREHKRRI